MRLPDLSRFSRRRRDPGLTREQAMAARPVRNQAIAWERQESGRVVLTVPLAFRPWMKLLKAITPISEQRQIELDELGSDVWEWCDGEADVRTLADKLSKTHQLNAREAELSLTQYLQMLARRRLLGFAVRLGEGSGDAAEAVDDGRDQRPD